MLIIFPKLNPRGFKTDFIKRWYKFFPDGFILFLRLTIRALRPTLSKKGNDLFNCWIDLDFVSGSNSKKMFIQSCFIDTWDSLAVKQNMFTFIRHSLIQKETGYPWGLPSILITCFYTFCHAKVWKYKNNPRSSHVMYQLSVFHS